LTKYTVACIVLGMLYERELALAWRDGAWLGRELTTTEGQRFRVICPGYSGLSWGPDFRRAAIELRGRKVRGDIEFHVHSRDWVEHGHHRDIAYDRVILHVAWKDDMPGPTLTSGGVSVPVFAAGSAPHYPQPDRSLFCRGCATAGKPELLRSILARQGKLWFLDKARRNYEAFEKTQPEEVLYRGILEALGYSENKAPFYELAVRLPFRALRKDVRGLKREERLSRIRELYLASSGLMPGAANTEISLTGSDWRLYGLRPANHPLRRLTAASCLIARYLDDGLVKGLVRVIGSLEPGEAYDYSRLMVGDDADREYRIQDMGYRGHSRPLGRSRALLIAVNVILPFAYALGKKEGGSLLRRRALSLFRRCPSSGDNIVIRHFRRLWGLRLKLSAREEQGLMRMEKAFCSQGRCGRCPVNWRPGRASSE